MVKELSIYGDNGVQVIDAATATELIPLIDKAAAWGAAEDYGCELLQEAALKYYNGTKVYTVTPTEV